MKEIGLYEKKAIGLVNKGVLAMQEDYITSYFICMCNKQFCFIRVSKISN